MAKINDEDYVNHLFGSMSMNDMVFKSVLRIGKPNPDKKRPIKLIMSSEDLSKL